MPKIHVSEHTTIKASPERVFDAVADFGTWTTWSPWLRGDSHANVDITPNSNSVGSVYSWQGDVVGEGQIEHAELSPGKQIRQQLRFIKPWKSQAAIRFDFEPVGDETKVTWTMDSSLPWFMFWMKSMMEGTIGMDYDRGLRMLKEQIETGKVLSKTTVRGIESVGPLHLIGKRKTSGMDDIGPVMEQAIMETELVVQSQNLATEGTRAAVYHAFDAKNRSFEFTAGYLLLDPNATAEGFESWSLPASKALAVQHNGSYENLGNSWSAAYQHVRYQKLKQNAKAGTFEIYRNDPRDVSSAELITDIFLPLR